MFDYESIKDAVCDTYGGIVIGADLEIFSARLWNFFDALIPLLPDTMEDTPVTAEYFSKYFPAEMVETVKVLTRPEGEDYFGYINKIALNPLAKKVKLADLTHNMDMTRFRTVTGWDLRRLEKYKKAYAILTENS